MHYTDLVTLARPPHPTGRREMFRWGDYTMETSVLTCSFIPAPILPTGPLPCPSDPLGGPSRQNPPNLLAMNEPRDDLWHPTVSQSIWHYSINPVSKPYLENVRVIIIFFFFTSIILIHWLLCCRYLNSIKEIKKVILNEWIWTSRVLFCVYL